MKKLLKFGVLALVVVLVSGCGKASEGKVLTCTMSEKEEAIAMTMTMKATFKEDKATDLSLEGKITVDESLSQYMDALKTTYDNQFGAFAKKDGIDYTSKVKDNTINFTLSIDTTKASEADLKEMDMDGTSGTYEEAKKALEKENWTCK